jgi:type IV pilus assembly protein PilN
MQTINLLPWRNEEKARRSGFLLQVFFLCITFCNAGLLWLAVELSVTNQKDGNRNNEILIQTKALHNQSIYRVSLNKDYQSLSEKLFFLKELQQRHSRLINLLLQMNTIIAPGINLTQIKSHDELLELYGEVNNEKLLTDFMTRLQRVSGWHNPLLVSFTREHQEPARRGDFIISLSAR